MESMTSWGMSPIAISTNISTPCLTVATPVVECGGISAPEETLDRRLGVGRLPSSTYANTAFDFQVPWCQVTAVTGQSATNHVERCFGITARRPTLVWGLYLTEPSASLF